MIIRRVEKLCAALCLLTLLATLGCGSLALMPRSAPELDGDELAGEITGIDLGGKQIFLRPSQAGSERSAPRTIRFDEQTQVMYQGREYPVSSLEVGDVVALQVWNRERGASTDLIRVQQSSRERGAAPSDQLQRIEGTVQQVDAKAGIFELRATSGANVRVSLPPDARQSMSAQVDRLRRGDRVLAEGRYLSRDAFELERFL